ncbi:MAG: sulfotransferase family protein [Acidimicrobiales bacterium]
MNVWTGLRPLASSSARRVYNTCRPVFRPAEAYLGRPARVLQRYRLYRRLPSAESGLASFVERWGAGDATDDPVLVCSAGWRSGSTLLQRLVTSSNQVLIWGEPYSGCSYVQRLSKSFQPFALGWPRDSFFLGAGRQAEELAQNWIANLYPEPAQLLSAHRAFLRELFAKPAKQRGFPRWGLKETHLDAEDVGYLATLFPASTVLLLVRNPVDAWASYCRIGEIWFASYPKTPVVSAADFARHWEALASGMHAYAAKRPRCLLVRFEDLVKGGGILDEIGALSGLKLDPSVLSVRVDGTADPGGYRQVTTAERRVIARIAGPTAVKFGYRL